MTRLYHILSLENLGLNKQMEMKAILINLFILGFTISSFSQVTITKRIASSTDDAEEAGTAASGSTSPEGTMYLNSSDLELVKDNNINYGDQKIGLRFTGLSIPQGASITSANLTFYAISPDSPMTNSEATSLTFKGELSSNSSTFTSTLNNISSRTPTAASQTWSPTTWNSGNYYNSPSLSGIIQEIVNQGSWASGNALSIVITGTGHRSTHAYDGNTSLAPLLTVTYSTAPAINLSAAITDVLCRGGSTGAIDLNVTGGTAPFDFDWSHNGITQPASYPDTEDISGLVAGKYIVYVKDAAGVTANLTVTITQPNTNITLSKTISNVTSTGGSNGAVDLTVTGGSPTYSYLWSDGATTEDISNKMEGTYSVTVTDANLCTATTSAVISEVTNQTIAVKDLYLNDALGLDRSNPANPIDNTTALTSTLSAAPAAVTIDNTSSKLYAGDNLFISLPHTTGTGNNRLMLVGVSIKDMFTTSVTYGGEALTKVGENITNGNAKIYIYSLLNPTSGTANVIVNADDIFDKGGVVGVMTFNGVDQANPYGTFASFEDNNNTPSINVPSVAGQLVFDVLSERNRNQVADISQTERWKLNSGSEIRGSGSTKLATSTSTAMNWTLTDGNSDWALGGVAIKPAPTVTNLTFTENPVLCSALTIKSGNTLTVRNYVDIIGGTMPANPNITAVLKYGATTIATLSSPTYSGGLLTWATTIGADVTVPAGSAIAFEVTTAQAGVDFIIRYDSQTYPSKVSLPVSTFINTNSVEVFDASYPSGTQLTNVPNTGNSYIRIAVSDPFGTSDITSVNLTLTKPGGATINTTLTTANVIATIGCIKYYQYTWSNPVDIGSWSIQAVANEGTEGTVFHSRIVNANVAVPAGKVTQIKQLYLNDALGLDRSNPADPVDNTTAQTSIISSGNTVSFTQNPILCSPLTIKASQTITITNYVTIVSGTMPANPTITAALKNGATTFASFSNPTYSGGLLTWTGTLPSDVTIPTGNAIILDVTSGQAGVTFKIDYDSQTKPSLIELPVTTYIDITSLAMFDGAYPGGSVLSTAANASTVYLRSTVTDPFGFSDITGLDIKITAPGGGVTNVVGTSVAGAGCTRTYEYVWNSPATPGDYSFVATAKEGTENSVIDVDYLNFSLCPITVTSVVTKAPTCLVPDNGEVSLNVIGGNGPYSWTWNRTSPTTATGSGTGDVITGLIAGTYDISVSTPGGCSGTTSITLNSASGPTLSSTVAPTTCLGNDGAIDLVVTGGSGDFTYFWDDGAATQDRVGISPGFYNIIVTDNINGCTSSVTIEVIQGSFVSAMASIFSTTCFGGNDGSIILTPSGGSSYTYLWDDGGITTKNRENLLAGTYGVTISSGACSGYLTFQVNEPAELTATTNVTPVTCFSSGKIDLTVSGGTEPYTYDWADISGSTNIKNRSGLEPGTYTVIITDSKGCSEVKTEILTTPSCPVPTYSVCKTDASSVFSTTPDPYVNSYTWTVPSGAIIVSGQNTESITVDWTGTIGNSGTVCVKTVNDCGESADLCYTVYIREVTAGAAVDSPVCTNGDIVLTGSGGTSYLWSGPSGFTSGNEQATIYNPSAASHDGTYSVTVTDIAGCAATATVAVSVKTAPTATLSLTNATCGVDDGNASVLASGGMAPYTYLWSNASQTASISNLSAGAYFIEVTDANGCSVSETALIGNASAPIITTNVTQVACFGAATGSITTSLSGGVSPYTYLWSNGDTTSAISNLTDGNYSLIVTDNNGCQQSASEAITEPDAIQIDKTQTDILCFGDSTGTITLTVTGGTGAYTYTWSDGPSTAKDRTGLAAGTYTVTVMDAALCTVALPIIITEPTSGLSASTVVTPVSCNGENNGIIDLTVSGGTSPYTYLWSNGDTTQDITGLTPAIYTVTITDSKGCVLTPNVSAEVTQPAVLALTNTKTDNLCFGGTAGTIDLTISGGTAPYVINWNNGAITEDLSSLTAGTYIVNVTDANGCTAADTVTLTDPSELVASFTKTDALCNGGLTGTINLTISGGSGAYSFVWADDTITTQNRTGLAAGNYSVIIKDVNNCEKTLSISIEEPDVITSSAFIENTSCNGDSDGTITQTVNGGTGSYTYTWSDGPSTSKDRTGLSANSYIVTIKDSTNCELQKTFIVGEPAVLVATATKTDISCFEETDGSISLSVVGGNTPYTYSWSNGANTKDISALSQGTYTVTITDAKNCVATDSVIINEPAVLNVTGTFSPNCPASSNGSINLTVTGGTGVYTYVWSDGPSTDQDRTGLGSGTYTVNVTDARGCTETASFTLIPMVLVVSGNPTSCLSVDGKAFASVSGGTIPYTYLWSNAATTENLISLTSGTYSVTVTDANGCTATGSVTLDPPVCNPPVAQDDNYTTPFNTVLSGTVAPVSSLDPGFDSDPDNILEELEFYPLSVIDPALGSIDWSNTFDGSFIFTPATNFTGTVSVNYSVCDPLGLCDEAALTIIVGSNIKPTTESITVFASLGGTMPNIASNDTVNGLQATLGTGNAIVATKGTWPDGITLNPTTGDVAIAIGTMPGVYPIEYTLCDTLTPLNCADMMDTVTVIPSIQPITESITVSSATGGTMPNIASNDTVNGIQATLGGTGNAMVAEKGTWPTGITLNATTGDVTIAIGTTPGVYPVEYTLCDTLSPVSCADMMDTVTVTPSIQPFTESITVASVTGGTMPNIASNDTVNSLQATLGGTGNATVAEEGTWPSGITLDTITGNVSIAPGTFAGVYPVTYKLCDTLSPTPNCALMNDTITVTAMPDTIIITPPCTTCAPPPICATADDIVVDSTTTYSMCSPLPSTQGTAALDVNGCLIFTPNGVNTDTVRTCIVACTNGVCDTTYIVITPVIVPDTITVSVTPGTTSVSLCPTADQIGAVTSVVIQECVGAPSEGTYTTDVNGCLVYTASASGSGIDSLCVIGIDANGNRDTTVYVINVPANPTYPDTVIITPPCTTCPTPSICATADDIVVDGTTTYSFCSLLPSTQGTAALDSSGCLIFTPNGVNTDTVRTCVVACTNGVCDTTYIIITPVIVPDTISVSVPPGTTSVSLCPTADQIGTVTSVAIETCAGAPSEGTYITDVNGCLVYTANASGNGIDSLCVIGIDANGNRDTTVYVINVPATPPVDIELTKTTNAVCEQAIGNIITYEVVVKRNDNEDQIVNVIVKDSLSSNMELISAIPDLGSFDTNTNQWTGVTLAKGDSAVLTVQARILTTVGGLACNTAWVSYMDKPDKDSSPSNMDIAEDDIAKACVSVPMELCVERGETIQLSAPAGYSSYQWLKAGSPILGASAATYTATAGGIYTVDINDGSGCGFDGCCPITILEVCSCPANVCIPFLLLKTK
jgi:hypothetical protein